jgi:hypothetical protein
MKLTIRHTFFIVLLLGLFLMALRPIADPDFWWHLRTGQLIVQTRSIPYVDPFSFTKLGGIWITHEWLSEVFIYSLFQLGGYGLLIFFFALIITGAFLVSYLRSPEGTRPYVAGFVLVLGAISTAPTWGVRPQMISLLITSIFLFLLDGYKRAGNYKFLIPLPLITLIWVNLHAGYLLGLALMGIYIFGGLVEILVAQFHNAERAEGIPHLRPILIQCCFLGTCVLAALANPNGIKIIIYPFQTLISPSMQQLIQEWFSPDFHQLMWQPFAWLILALIGIGMISKKSISPTNILLTLFLGYAALRSMRNIPLFVIAVIPFLSDQIGSLINIPIEKGIPSRLFSIIAPILLLFLTLVIGLRFVQVIREQSTTESENFPKAAVDWLLENKPQGNLFNSYGWGGYLIWKMFPEYRVYIDGRADVYGDKFIFDYMTVYRAEPGWEGKLNAQDVHTVLIESDAPLAYTLSQSTTWQIAYHDKTSTVFTR